MLPTKSAELYTIEVWNLKFNPIRIHDFIETVGNRIKLNLTPIHITGVNPETVVHAFKNQTIKQAINDSDLVNIDNYLVVIILRLLGFYVPCRVATPDLFESLLAYSDIHKFKIFILGSKQTTLDKAIENIKLSYKNIEIYSQHGYYFPDQEVSIIQRIIGLTPDIVFIAMPTPTKETFILNYKKEINAKVYLGVGGAIDVKAGIVKRAPKILREVGFEGLHRSFQNPLNYGMRIIKYYPRFLKIVMKYRNAKRK